MSTTFTTQRRIEFCDTDAAGIAHFSVFFKFMEQAEHEFLRSRGLSVVSEIDGQLISWPRVNAQCDFRGAARFEELIDIHVSVLCIGQTSITYKFEFFRDGGDIADGVITAVCCEVNPGTRPKPIKIPSHFVDALSPFLSATAKHKRHKP